MSQANLKRRPRVIIFVRAEELKSLPPPRVDSKKVARSRVTKSIRACALGNWHIRLWPKKDPSKIQLVPYRCRSWRHEGDCRLFKGKQDFGRIVRALEKHDFWLHVVLTFEQPPGANPESMYKEGLTKWAKLRKRIVRRYGKVKYVQTWERHRTGFPHVHFAMSSCAIYESAVDRPAANWIRMLQRDAVECGFGPIGWIERLHSKQAMARYLNTLAAELTGRGKDYQVPENAPPHFRRLRSTRGLLEPVYKNPELGGELVRCPIPYVARS